MTSPGIRPAGAPLVKPLSLTSGDSAHPFDNRSRQIPNAARLVFVGRHHAVPFTFIPFSHATFISGAVQYDPVA